MAKIELESLDPRLQEAIRKAKGHRANRVLQHILNYGSVTTEDLENLGYKHPPRAARDVRELGIPLKTQHVAGSTGKKIACYSFGDPADVEDHKFEGRRTLSKEIKEQLYIEQNQKCALCQQEYEDRYLQIDHRVPYEIAGESGISDEISGFMLLCVSCQRRKSWTCEHYCENKLLKSVETCTTCMWANPESYQHITMQKIRSITITFSGDDVEKFDELRELCDDSELMDIAREAILKIVK